MTSPLRPITVRFDGGADTFTGYTDGETWNGWECPYLPPSEVERLRVWLAAEETDLPVLDEKLHATTDGERLLCHVNEGLCFSDVAVLE